MNLSICTTNYNCAHALPRHLTSIYGNLRGLDFEYVVVDNFSKDQGLRILEDWASANPNMRVLRRRCTMGEGRQIAFRHTTGSHIMVVDTDVVYEPVVRKFIDRYFEKYSGYSVQALFCGIFPRDHWHQIGGRRSLNTNEDVDMWVRLWKRDLIRWYPVPMGINLKEDAASGSFDHLSGRYTRPEQVLRLFRRQWDLWKTREVQDVNLEHIITSGTVDLELGLPLRPWPQRRTRQSSMRQVVEFVRLVKQTLNQP